VICAIGAYTVHNAMPDIWFMLLFGVVGYLFKNSATRLHRWGWPWCSATRPKTNLKRSDRSIDEIKKTPSNDGRQATSVTTRWFFCLARAQMGRSSYELIVLLIKKLN
jgi:hypothetical protein